jgi:hypothetical protein
MARFFRRNGFYASKEEVGAIVRRLDLNYDQVVTKEELAKYILNASRICSDKLAKSHYNNTNNTGIISNEDSRVRDRNQHLTQSENISNNLIFVEKRDFQPLNKELRSIMKASSNSQESRSRGSRAHRVH